MTAGSAAGCRWATTAGVHHLRLTNCQIAVCKLLRDESRPSFEPLFRPGLAAEARPTRTGFDARLPAAPKLRPHHSMPPMRFRARHQTARLLRGDAAAGAGSLGLLVLLLPGADSEIVTSNSRPRCVGCQLFAFCKMMQDSLLRGTCRGRREAADGPSRPGICLLSGRAMDSR